MKYTFCVLFSLFYFNSKSQFNSNILYSNIFKSDIYQKLVPKYPNNDYLNAMRKKNLEKISLDSIDKNFDQCINEFRRDYRLGSLTYNEKLAGAAYLQVFYFIGGGTIGHYNPDFGETPLERVKFAGYTDFYWVGEVCLMDHPNMMEYPNSQTVNLEYTRTIFDLYWSSQHHREILQDPKYKQYGFYNHYDKKTQKFYNVIVVTD